MTNTRTAPLSRQAAETIAARIESGEVRYNSKVQNHAEVFWYRLTRGWAVSVYIMTGPNHDIPYGIKTIYR
jgi:hypothetical protein